MQHQNGVIRRTTMSSGVAPMDADADVSVDGNVALSFDGKEDDAKSTSSTYSRTCVLGCQVNKLALCRFPVHDPKRLNNWLKFFDISVERVESLGGLANLRVCLKHFNQKQQMAKTRIKTTPTRLQKVALAAINKATAEESIITTTTTTTKTTPLTTTTINNNNNNKAMPELKRQAMVDHQSNRTRSSSNASTIIVSAPKRTTSISSATSTLSQTSSDSQSDTDCTVAITTKASPPHAQSQPTMAINGSKRISQQTKCSSNNNNNTNNNNNNNDNSNDNINSIALLNKLSSNGKRKVYMITEKSTEYATNESAKRKMYLIMEDQNGGDGGGDAMASLHISNQQSSMADNKRKKLTFYTDNMNSELCTQKFEQILPEILNRIQQQKGAVQQQATTNGSDEPHVGLKFQDQNQQQQQQQQQQQEDKVPITLPPKKNRIKIERNAQEEDETRYHATSDAGNAREFGVDNAVVTAASTPVIVSNVNAVAVVGVSAGIENNKNNDNNNTRADAVLTTIDNRSNGKKSIQQHNEKQINLSSDFLFLMKMLPKLESIPEPQKQQVKLCIESFIEQSAGVGEGGDGGGNHDEPIDEY